MYSTIQGFYVVPCPECHTCYMQKNICQACLLDLEYGPPVQTRAGFYESYKSNASHICTFYISGECTSGDECPYWIEMPVTRTPIPEVHKRSPRRRRTTGFEDYNGQGPVP